MVGNNRCTHNLDPQVCARCNRKDIAITAEGGVQSKLNERPSLLPPRACLLAATILGIKAREYGEWNWRKIPTVDHLDHIQSHAFKHVLGDKSEFHPGNILCRALFLVDKLLEEGTHGYDLSYLGLDRGGDLKLSAETVKGLDELNKALENL